ncbi:MAG: sulfatase family protein [Solirubrobacterales bacterium]
MQGLIGTRISRTGGALLVALGCLSAALLLRGGEAAQGASSKPNVVMFTTDDQTLRDMIAMPRTTNLIGGQGTNFQRAFVSFPLCCPSRVSVQTGQYAHNHHVLGNTPPAGGYQTFNDTNDLPVWLQTAGYRTIHIGKMPNGFGTDPNAVPPGWGPFLGDANPLSKGEFYAFLGPGSTYFAFQLDENGTVKQYDGDEYQTDTYADIAVDRIDNHVANFPNTPLYMQVQFFAPHDPNQPATRHAGALSTVLLPVDKSFNEKDLRDKPAWVKRINRLGGGLISKIATRYRGRLETLLAVDEAIERIVAELEADGQLGNTYLIFTSDNGFMQGQHRLHQGKFVPYEPSIQVPLLIRGPGIPAGGISKELVSNVDITSTILEMTGAAAGLTQDGRSLLPFARDPRLKTTRPILLETGPPGAIGEIASASSKGRRAKVSKYVKNLDLDRSAQIARVITAPRYRAIRTGRYLLVKYGDGGRELYDLLKDRLEVNSFYKDARYKPVRKFLLKALAKLSPCVGASCNLEIGKPPKPLPKPKPKVKKKKKAAA